MAITMLSNMVDPEVMARMVSAKLPKKIKFSPIARIDTTLVGQPGSTITIPKFQYIGDAEDVAEGVAIDTTVLTKSTAQETIKKAGKAVELTDESVLSGYGSPLDEAVRQLTESIAAKVDNDGYDELCGASLVYDGTGAVIAYNGVVDANAIFDDENDDGLKKIMFINPAQEATIRKDANFMDKNKYPLDVVMNGTIGAIAGAQVVKSKKVKRVEYEIDNTSGTITIVDDATTEDSTHKHLSTVAAKTLGAPKVGDKIEAVAAAYYACPIVIVDERDPNEDPSADGVADGESALVIYLKRAVNVEQDRDILKKTTVISADEHYVAALSNESKVVLAKFKA